MDEKLISVFLATCFAKKCRELAEYLRDTLNEAGFTCVLGENFGLAPISAGVKESIESCDIFIALVCRPCGTKKEVSQWVTQEIGCASGFSKPCLAVVEEGADFVRGMLGDAELVQFKRRNFASIFPKVLRQLNTMLHQQGLTIGIRKTAEPWFFLSDEPNESECGAMAAVQMRRARALIQRKELDLAADAVKKAIVLDPDCWQARLRLGSLMVVKGDLADGESHYLYILEHQNGNSIACAAAYHNLAALLERRFPLPRTNSVNEKISQRYRMALRLDPTRLETRAPLVCCYLRLKNHENANALFTDSVGYGEAFNDLMREELGRSPDGHKLFAALPLLAQNLLRPMQQNKQEGDRKMRIPSFGVKRSITALMSLALMVGSIYGQSGQFGRNLATARVSGQETKALNAAHQPTVNTETKLHSSGAIQMVH